MAAAYTGPAAQVDDSWAAVSSRLELQFGSGAAETPLNQCALISQTSHTHNEHAMTLLQTSSDDHTKPLQ